PAELTVPHFVLQDSIERCTGDRDRARSPELREEGHRHRLPQAEDLQRGEERALFERSRGNLQLQVILTQRGRCRAARLGAHGSTQLGVIELVCRDAQSVVDELAGCGELNEPQGQVLRVRARAILCLDAARPLATDGLGSLRAQRHVASGLSATGPTGRADAVALPGPFAVRVLRIGLCRETAGDRPVAIAAGITAGNAIAPEARTCLTLAPFLGKFFRARAGRIAALALVHPAVVFAGSCLVPLAPTAELCRMGAVFALKAPGLTGGGALE